MNQFSRLAIVGIGPSAIYVLQQLFREIDRFRPALTEIFLFERGAQLGVGMPYDRHTTDVYNLCNISSSEIPPLHDSLVEWLHSLSDEQLSLQGIVRSDIDADETYRRTTLGDYFQGQFTSIAASLRAEGVTLHEFRNCSVSDVVDHPESEQVEIRFGVDDNIFVDRVVIATGHSFVEPDEPENGYFASPWPMQKLIPVEGHFHNCEIGLLGASLSAFDVVSSLSHRHGEFVRRDTLVYEPFPGTENFRMVLHSAEGWLPHLQYEQLEPFRVVYRHVDRDTMLSMRDENGFLPLDDYFDQVCRPALAIAFEKDKRADIVELLTTQRATLEAFVQTMSDEHTAEDPFALMRLEMRDAKRSLRKGIPIHWKETLDDLMYTLNFHYDFLSAEDHLRYRKVVMTFLMNVIAAMPLHSANIMLALHDAGRLDLVSGKVAIQDKRDGRTFVEIESGDSSTRRAYQIFVNCSGQGGLDRDSYPFRSLIADGTVSEAVAYFRDRGASAQLAESDAGKVVKRGARTSIKAGGVAIDGYYRLVDEDGVSNPRIHDVAFPHATGIRPYSYGLQACDATASIVVQSWCAELDTGRKPSAKAGAVTGVYEEIPEPSERAE